MRRPALTALLALLSGWAPGCYPRSPVPTPEGRPCEADGSCGPETYCHPLSRRCIPCATAIARNCAAGPKPSLPAWSEIRNEWCVIPAGCFIMGSPADQPCRGEGAEAPHQVTLTHPFKIEQTEATQATFFYFAGYNPSVYREWPVDNTCPVEQVSWHAAVEYCNLRSIDQNLEPCYADVAAPGRTCSKAADCGTDEACVRSTCKRYEPVPAYAEKVYSCPGYRLPTEAEWEYAYRAGARTGLYNGDLDAANCGGRDPTADEIAIYGPFGGHALSVAQKQENGWGLSDMAGNVSEWCHDDYQESLGTAPVVDPVSTGGSTRVIRGGSYLTGAGDLRGAARAGYQASMVLGNIGFRCVISLWSCRQASDCQQRCGVDLNCLRACSQRHLCTDGAEVLGRVTACAMQNCLSHCSTGYNDACMTCLTEKCQALFEACQNHAC